MAGHPEVAPPKALHTKVGVRPAGMMLYHRMPRGQPQRATRCCAPWGWSLPQLHPGFPIFQMAAGTQVLLDLKKDEGRHHTNAKHLQAPWRIVTAQGMLDPSALSEGDGQRGGTCLTNPAGLLEGASNAKICESMRNLQRATRTREYYDDPRMREAS